MVYQVTKWVECIPLPSQTAEVTAQAAVTQFFAHFGYPFQIFTDQGRNFESHLFKRICELLQIHKARTTAAVSQRPCRTFQPYPDGCHSMLHLIFPCRTDSTCPDQQSDEYVRQLEEQIQRAHDTARSTLGTVQKHMKRDYDLKVNVHPFKVGDLVYLLDTASIKGKCGKLSHFWKGQAL